DRYRNEVARLYGVLDTRLADREYVAGDYSIADMAIWPWATLWENQEQDITEFPNMKAWLDRVGSRPAVREGRALAEDQKSDAATDREAQKILFGHRPRR
ncbi:MAG TPA: glutathione binding-like protein, partial [Paracoccaceae bacterium]|nr:glutathione binding-like protein [Paracoccaceae bacterium]